ncbi:FYVE zinc finger-domain-containing protein [Pholiota molesta]|nr:FYVE zinc finger-domain-containing protein [Pholiota molesta]
MSFPPAMPSVPALDSSPSSSASSLLDVPPTAHDRPNEHLAVLLAKHLWKPDSSSSTCDNFYCRVPFSLFERKHHCRKCGGIFCGACTSRTTPLLDTSNLSFLQPPRNSPTSPILDSRVCDDCWDQIHGCPTTPHTPDGPRPSFKRALSHPISMFKLPLSPQSSSVFSLSASSSSSSDAILPPSISSKSNSLRQSPSASSLNTQSSTNSVPTRSPRRINVRTTRLPLPQDLERSYGELDAYPLRRSSVLCKATGGGRWVPKQIPVLDGYRQPIPGGKAPFEIEMEREEMLERQRRLNPVVKDGAFQYRFPKEPEPDNVSRSLCNLSTF